VEEFLEQIEEEGLLVSVKPLRFHLPDPDDEPFLEVALSGGVEAIVTGNKRHFPKRGYEGVKILSPTGFLEAVKGKI
jgi:predicted nucleic acid-binding protein